ncbi:MAG: helicase [Bryobacterales bacterium]|nr:helicase [Bryobacterales bacterium]
MPEPTPTSADVRQHLAEALRLDLVGPDDGLGDGNEILPQAPSRWYLTGFLIPKDAPQEQRVDAEANEELDAAPAQRGYEDDDEPEQAPIRQRFLPSSIGLSVLVSRNVDRVTARVSWGDYVRERTEDKSERWRRKPGSASLELPLGGEDGAPRYFDVPGSRGLQLVAIVRAVDYQVEGIDLPPRRTVSVFLVNRRDPAPDARMDEAFAFQACLELGSEAGFLARLDLHGLRSKDYDERVADLQYRDVGEYAVGHNVSAKAVPGADGACRVVRTAWIPRAEVEHVAPTKRDGVTISMDELAGLADADEARAKLLPMVEQYRDWIGRQEIPATPERRREIAEHLLQNAGYVAERMERGIERLADPLDLEAFRLTNKVMALAARRRLGVMQGRPPEEIRPEWRPFQLAFLLMNLDGVSDPLHADRETVDLLFFPTGGGKTEAYLGLAAYTLLLRRLRNPGPGSCGLSVLMRYTLRLLTLDQLSRAATLICALELERQGDEAKLGQWPFEIGLWVGKAATPNRMGSKEDNYPDTARRKTDEFVRHSDRPSPIPLEECPWCGEKFGRNSFRLYANGRPDRDYPTDLLVACVNRRCEFSRDQPLPILGVDEPIYRRLPCFLIATVDKFAGMPWKGDIGKFFGRADRYDRHGFYGPCETNRGALLKEGRLPPPDLIIQDELHLISGPLGTMAGLYETALDELSIVEVDGRKVRPKIVASTATVRHAETQIRALFDRRVVEIFPPPGPNRRDSFFAETLPTTESNARLYLGVAAQGRSPKVVMLRVYLALLGAAQKHFHALRKKGEPGNPADPYMTLLGYFNALRELGGARRLIEDEIRNRLAGYGSRLREGEAEGLFADRRIEYEPVELTSRINSGLVAQAKRRLALPFSEDRRVDVAIATNMISVGLDITRLGLMVVFGQPKTSAEYIQATSRVGRDPNRPGLVVTILNVHKPRDRSHYERFAAYHETFYRSVEATSVTPFSPRALDKGLAGTLVAMSRQGHETFTPPRGAEQILKRRAELDAAVDALAERAYGHRDGSAEDQDRLRRQVRQRVNGLLDDWTKAARELGDIGAAFQYNEAESGAAKPLLHDYLSAEVAGLPPTHWKMKFRAPRSLRDVEPSVALWVKTLENIDLEEDG